MGDGLLYDRTDLCCCTDELRYDRTNLRCCTDDLCSSTDLHPTCYNICSSGAHGTGGLRRGTGGSSSDICTTHISGSGICSSGHSPCERSLGSCDAERSAGSAQADNPDNIRCTDRKGAAGEAASGRTEASGTEEDGYGEEEEGLLLNELQPKAAQALTVSKLASAPEDGFVVVR